MPREYYQLIEWFNEQVEPDCNPPPAKKLSVEKIPRGTRLSELEELLEHLSGYGKIDDYSVHWETDRFRVCITFNSIGDAYRLSAEAKNMRLVWRNRALRVSHSSIETDKQPEDSDSTANAGNKSVDSDTNIHILNDDCLIQIFLRLPILDRIRLERVSKRWRTLSQASWLYVKKLYLLRAELGIAQSESNTILPETLCTVLRRCGSRLQEIYLSDVVDDVFGETLGYIGQFCPNVQIIHSTWSSCISPKSIEMLSRKCREIRCLSIDVFESCDFELTQLLKASTKLTHISGEIEMHGECLLHLPHNTIREIQLSNCRNSVLDYLTQVLPKFDSLSTLSLGHHDTIILELPIAILEALSRHRKQLKRLGLMSLILPKRSIELIIEFSNLEHLDLHETNINDEFLIRLSGKCQKLTYLNIDCSAITWTGIAALASLPKLDKLIIIAHRVYDCPKEWRKEPLRLQRLPRSSDFPSLKHLEYGDQRILRPSELLCLIESSPLLRLVDFSWSHAEANYGIEWIISETLARNNKVVFFVQ